ncbi:hypothetical protein ABPG73_002725 [Tetrahymena malaccensis]
MEKFQTFRREVDDHFYVLDQLKLPLTIEEIRINTIEDAWRVIKDMNVRGAPLIAVVATQGLRNELFNKDFKSAEELRKYVLQSVEYLRTSRPTAVNLQNDTERVRQAVIDFNLQQNEDEITQLQQLKQQLFQLIDSFNQQYIDACRQMSILGVDAIIRDFEEKHPEKVGQNAKLKVLTICNTGKLATPGDGTALGIVRELHRRGRLERLYIAETRPYNQGARLTASEAVLDKLPATLITDSMAGFLMQQGNIDFVVAGADRVAKNGDTANKIGTYTFAVLAKHHNVNFYVALPTQTIDENTLRGADIHIEQRPKNELTHVMGVQIAPTEIEVWNPSFDVTPSFLIKRIFHEGGEYECDRTLGNWKQMDAESLKSSLISKYNIFSQAEESSLKVSEIGDGNLNLVFIVSSDLKQVIVKQALPYVRCVGPTWPFPLNRAFFENEALQFHNQVAPELIPKPLFFDKENSLIVMEYLAPPYIILRKGLIQRIKYPKLAKDIAIFSAKTHFYSSSLHLDNKTYREKVRFWSENTEMCTLTEQVIFSDPYVDSHYNKWTTPHLDEIVKTIKTGDDELIIAISELRHKFITAKEALIHGDLHTGSIMVTENETRVIDPEFAFYGPIGFDTGAFVANLFLNFFSQKQHESQANQISEYSQWLLDTTVTFYNQYEEEFLNIWNGKSNVQNGGDFPPNLINKNTNIKIAIQIKYLKNIFQDTLGFAAAKIIRRIIGIAHVEDLDSITNPDIRSKCEIAAIKFARSLMVNRSQFKNIQEVVDLAKVFYTQ